MQLFIRKYCLSILKDLVTKAIEHLIDLKGRETIRTNQRKVNQREKQQRPYKSYDWEKLVVDGGLQKLTVPELDKYLVHHKLPTARKKKLDKIRCITCHICRSENGRVQGLVRQQTEPDSDEDEEGSSSESEAEIVAVEFGSSDEEVDGDEDNDDGAQESGISDDHFIRTRAGRVAGSWRNAFNF